MKTLFTALFTLGIYLTSFGQADFKNPPWETGCDSLLSQTDMNICSYEKFKIADSILNVYYNNLIKNVTSKYLRELKDTKGAPDQYQKEYLELLKGQKEAIVKSRDDFKKFRKSSTNIIEYEYTGGTMQSLVVNSYALELTVNQIKVLKEFTDEIIPK